jgi:hypothetical protein
MLNPDLPTWLLDLSAWLLSAPIVVAAILLAQLVWRLFSGAKPDRLEWHIPLATEKPPCGRWKYLGTVLLPWVRPRSRKDRNRAATLERKGITVTCFRSGVLSDTWENASSTRIIHYIQQARQDW